MFKRLKKWKKIIAAAVGCLLITGVLYDHGIAAQAEKYEYDALNRVTKVIYDDGSSVEYTYDPNGNILTTTVKQAESTNPDEQQSDAPDGEGGEALNPEGQPDGGSGNAPDPEQEQGPQGGNTPNPEGESEPADDPAIDSNPAAEEGIRISFAENIISKGESGEYETVYTGYAVKPDVIVKNNGRLLAEGTDYTLKYANNVNCSAVGATVAITGKGTYTGSDSLKFLITQKDIADADIEVGNTLIEKGKTADPVVVYKGAVLKKGRDYTVDADAGGTALLQGIGNFVGSRIVEITELDKSEYKKTKIKATLGKVSKIYNTRPQTLSESELKVTDASGVILRPEEDYAVSYSANVNAGTVKVTVVGKGRYSGTVKKSFKIAPAKQTVFTVGTDQSSYTFKKAGVKPVLTVTGTVNGDTVSLTEGKDYKVAYSANKKVGTGKYKLTFLGNYKGAKYTGNNTFTITAAEMTESNTLVITGDMLYKKPARYQPKGYVIVDGSLLTKSDYQTIYSESAKIALAAGETRDCAVTVSPKGNRYKSNANVTFTSPYAVVSGTDRIDVSKAKVSLTQNGRKVKTVAYTGRAVTFSTEDMSAPQVTLKIGRVTIDSAEIEKYFDIYYADNIETGKATILLEAREDSPYIGVCMGTFAIGKGKLGD